MRDDDIDRAIEQERIRLDSPLEDNNFLDDIDRGYIGFTKPQIKHVRLTPIEHLQALQGDWPMKDYMEDGSDSGMHCGDLENET